MFRRVLLPLGLLLTIQGAAAQSHLDSLLSVRGFSIAAPEPDRVEEFVQFIRDELVPRKVNTLVLRVDYDYEYESHPELRNADALSKEDVRKIVRACREGGIRVIPQINLLGHQSWAEELENLLKVYPEFDETPHIARFTRTFMTSYSR